MNLVLDLDDIKTFDRAVAGGKGAQLAELARIGGVRVPPGFCITTAAFRLAVSRLPDLEGWLERLSGLALDDLHGIRTTSAEVRRLIETNSVPPTVAGDIALALGRFDAETAFAVRSSATAEDLPTASFAGQQDTFLNVIGLDALLAHVAKCWASLFTERAVVYRMRNGIDHGKTLMAVVVQEMVGAEVSGVMFTADPLTSNRQVVSVDATFGLGEALVGGLVNPDNFRVRDGTVVTRTVHRKDIRVNARSGGGTVQEAVGDRSSMLPALTDAQLLELASLGRRIEAHFGCPQDIEWCLAAGGFQFVQSRPITTLFPVPAAPDAANRVYISVGHQQMMTDALRPLGLSFWHMVNPRMVEAGSRLFVDVTAALSNPSARAAQLAMLEKGQPLISSALQKLLERPGFLQEVPDGAAARRPATAAVQGPVEPEVVEQLVKAWEQDLSVVERDIQDKAGPALFEFILKDLEQLKRLLFEPRSTLVIFQGMDAVWWLNEHLERWLGDRNTADTLTQSVTGNVTTQMGLDLLDVADVVRRHPAVVAFLQRVGDDHFLEELVAWPGGVESKQAIESWLRLYGMRCVGEIDISRPRWAEHPAALLPMLLMNVRTFQEGEGGRRFAQGLAQARLKREDVAARLRALPGGEEKAAEVERMIERARALVGYREYPKYAWMRRLFVYKRALMAEAQRLVDAGVLADVQDVFSLRFDELQEVARSRTVDRALIDRRKEQFELHRKLFPPAVMTSEGEVVEGAYPRDGLPDGSLVGMGVSAGLVQGRARVVKDVDDADLRPGDILVTTFTDPSWTPLFVAVGGLVTEVGGPMTHGAVIAREYGLPAVVGVPGATRWIRDGQRIRVHGGEGLVELLPDVGAE
jgi:pyruvate,water dikinase